MPHQSNLRLSRPTYATSARRALLVMALTMASILAGWHGAANAATRFVGPTSSQPLALTAGDELLAVANSDNNSVTLFDLRNNANLKLAEVQVQKISNAGLKGFFSKLFMAEMVGYQKPDKRFFEYAIKSVHAHKSESLMIGDDPDADIVGAAHAGIDQVYFNHGEKACFIQPTWEIKSFGELKTFL